MSLQDFGIYPESEKTNSSKKRGALWLIVGLIAVLFAGFSAIAGFYLNSINKALDDIPRETNLVPPSYASRPPTAKIENQAINVLLLGSDARSGNDRGRSDTIIWVHIPGDRNGIYITSFTRDLWVQIPGFDKGKINWALAYGGVPLQVKTVETLVGARVDHVATIDFEGFIKLTEILDGVTVYNKYPSRSGGFVFPEGKITVKGERALKYVRERKNLPEGAWSRAERQRDVISAIAQRILSPEVLSNPAHFNELASQISKIVKVDSGLTNQLIYETAMSMNIDGGDAIHSLQAPSTGHGMIGDESIDYPDYYKLQELGQALRDDKMAEYVAKK